MGREGILHTALIISAWLVAFAWLLRVFDALRGLPNVANLLLPAYDRTPAGNPTLTVIVPARNEEKDIRACLESLLAQDYAALHILAIDDRSTDRTGPILDALATAHPHRLTALHIETLPPGWLGKTHAMALAAAQSDSDFLLFTDADVYFRPDALRRALAHVVATRADHFVLVPTTIIRRWDEGALLSFIQIFGIWAVRPWKVSDPRAKRDAMGIGAFNLIRRSAYENVGGFSSLRMEVIEDIGLARRVKRAGLVQHIAFGRNMVRLHWASGVHGLMDVMTKNIFSAFRFHVALVLLACGWMAVFCIAPFAAIFIPELRIPAALTLAAIATAYSLMSRSSGISPWNALFAPFAAVLLIYTLLRSTVLTLRQGGVLWRGTFYSLAELRKNAMPLF